MSEIARMLERGLDTKQTALGEEAARSVKVVAGACFGRCFPLVAARELEGTMLAHADFQRLPSPLLR